MKKLALIAGAAALVLPGAAFAKDDSHEYTYKRVDANSSADNNGEYRIQMQSESDFRGLRNNTSFTTIEGEQLEIDGKTAYKITPEGDRFFAPNGSYTTRNNQVVVIEDGKFIRLEPAPEMVSLEMDRDNR